ncbi:hypothetical protein NL676_003752 [Syzygium grande]|nr:hypothetical protein NL676_003752 [Syzygium grande]
MSKQRAWGPRLARRLNRREARPTGVEGGASKASRHSPSYALARIGEADLRCELRPSARIEGGEPRYGGGKASPRTSPGRRASRRARRQRASPSPSLREPRSPP